MIKKNLKQAFFIAAMTIQMAFAGDVTQIVVDSTADQTTPGLTTFREAIEQANLLSESEITFDPVVFSTSQVITLENGEITIISNVSITGPGADLLTIDADNLSRILNITDSSSAQAVVTIFGMTFTNGNSSGNGGCINSNESLKLRSSVITGCISEQDGGGLHNFNANGVVIENSSFINNTSEVDGGGLYISGSRSHRIINSTFSGNIAPRRGGGFVMINTSNINNVVNSTFSENQSSRGAGIFSNKPLNVLNSTIVNNTGPGVQLAQDAIQNTIIAGNTGGDCVFTETGFDNVSNFDGDGSCNTSPARAGFNDPMLGPLADNGGLTPTHLPLPGSPVIDMGDDALCTEFDQRGISRPQDGDGDGFNVCDIGAVESLTFKGDPIFTNGFDE